MEACSMLPDFFRQALQCIHPIMFAASMLRSVMKLGVNVCVIQSMRGSQNFQSWLRSYQESSSKSSAQLPMASRIVKDDEQLRSAARCDAAEAGYSVGLILCRTLMPESPGKCQA